MTTLRYVFILPMVKCLFGLTPKHVSTNRLRRFAYELIAHVPLRPTISVPSTKRTFHLNRGLPSISPLSMSDNDLESSTSNEMIENDQGILFDDMDSKSLSDIDYEEIHEVGGDGFLETIIDEDTPDPSKILYKDLNTSLDKTIISLEKKKNSLTMELEKAKNLESTMKRANLILSNLYRISPGMTQIQVEDWDENGSLITILLDNKNYGTAQEEAEALFAMARKMKRGSRVVEELLGESMDSMNILQDVKRHLISMGMSETYDMGQLSLLQIKLERTCSKTGFRMMNSPIKSPTDTEKHKSKTYTRTESTRYQPTFRKFLSPNGCEILVGRSRRENEAICFQVAKGEDIWMHARGTPGAHVLIQVRRGKPTPTDECLQFAANLAVFYSDARSERKAEVTTAEPKHILKPRGAPLGAVKLRKEGKTLFGRPQDVPQECKDAREESGVGWDEMGSKKAENRKWTNEKNQEIIAKIRADKRAKKNRRVGDKETDEI